MKIDYIVDLWNDSSSVGNLETQMQTLYPLKGSYLPSKLPSYKRYRVTLHIPDSHFDVDGAITAVVEPEGGPDDND